jgi:hypothetical protein
MTENRGHLTKEQVHRLLKPVREDRLERKQGLSYVPQQEVRAELIRIFGPGNVDHTMHEPQLLWEESEEKNGKTYHRAAYLAGCTLRVRDYSGNPVAEFTEWHVEQNANQPDRGEAHALAVTSAQSYALRRAAISLGDAMGLHLYAGGSVAPLVRGTLQLTDPESPLYEAPEAKKDAAEPTASVSRLQAATNVRDDAR